MAEKKAKDLKNNVANNFIDSTESIEKIQDHFIDKNRYLYQRYCRLLGRRPKTSSYPHYLAVGHPLNTFNDDWDGMLPSRYLEPFTYKCSLPAVLSPMENIGTQDPLTGAMKTKMNWLEKTKTLLHGISSKNNYKKFELLNENVAICPKHFLTAASLREKDPDIYFDSHYNWYYAGQGNMQLIFLNGQNYILHSVLNKLYFSEYSLEDMKINYDHVFSFDCGNGNMILETVYSAEQIIAMRLKTRIIILKMTVGMSTVTIEKLKEIETSIAYTGISFDPYHQTILYVTTLDNTLSIINTAIMKARTVKLPDTESLVNNWSTVNGFDRNTYGHLSAKSIQIYDKRANNIIHTVRETASISDMHCNTFSVVKKCEDIPFMYVGTSHHVFLMDLRNQGKHTPKMLQRWTHNMKCPPTYMSLCKFEVVKDLVCLSSQWFDDTCIVPNESDTFARGIQTSNIMMPFKPPTVDMALKSARMIQLCVDIYNPIEGRLYTSITGNAVIEKDEKYHVFTQNSLGDIFCHTLYPDHMEMPQDNGLEQLHEWSTAHKAKERILEVSKVIDIADLWKNLKKVPEDQKFGDKKLISNEELKFSQEELMEPYENGVLDSGLLDVWLGEEKDQETVNRSLTIDLHYSDSE